MADSPSGPAIFATRPYNVVDSGGLVFAMTASELKNYVPQQGAHKFWEGVDVPLPSVFSCLGHIHKDGFTISREVNGQTVDSWLSDDVAYFDESDKVKISFKLLEFPSINWHRFARGDVYSSGYDSGVDGYHINHMWPVGSARSFVYSASQAERDERIIIVAEMRTKGERAVRAIFWNCVCSKLEDLTLKRGEPIVQGVEYSVLEPTMLLYDTDEQLARWNRYDFLFGAGVGSD